jgi:8-oxo-dGTP pyrophosphatase MutT (NUDIX family)
MPPDLDVTFDELSQELPSRLTRELPGTAGQTRMAPRPRFGWRPGYVPGDARASGVLLLLYPVGGTPHLVLTVRDGALAHHAGQVSLPGGAMEPGESPEEAALREAHEEIGLDPAGVRIVGALSPLHVPVSGNVLYPCVALAPTRPSFRPDPREVERVIEVPLFRIADARRVGLDRRGRFERSVEVPYFDVGGADVWGATAMVLAEFLCVLGTPPNPR